MTAKLISVVNQKGGCGKTTTTMQVAGTLGLRGHRVLVVDMDPQATCVRWHSSADKTPFPADVLALPNDNEAEQLPDILRARVGSYDYILIDCPPSVDSATPSSALLISDLAVIPMIPSPNDLWASVKAKKLVDAARQHNPGLKAVVVLTSVQPRTSLAKLTRSMLSEDRSIPLAKSILTLRSVFRESPLDGSTVHGTKKAQAAVDEIEGLTDELISILN